MVKLRDALRWEAENEARRANQAGVRELTANPEPSRGFANAVKAMDTEASRARLVQAREFVNTHPSVLDRIGLDAVATLQAAVPELGVSEARYVLEEFNPNQSDTRW